MIAQCGSTVTLDPIKIPDPKIALLLTIALGSTKFIGLMLNCLINFIKFNLLFVSLAWVGCGDQLDPIKIK